MFAIVVLFIFFLWVIGIIIAMIFGYKLLRRFGILMALFGMFLGFMLLAGGWIIRWKIENWHAIKYAEEACQKTGVWVYIQPREWRQLVGGEEAWKKLGYGNLSTQEKKNIFYPDTLEFEGVNYEFSLLHNARIASYRNDDVLKKPNSSLISIVYYDVVLRKVLYKYNISYSTSKSIGNGLKALFWERGIDCADIYKEQIDTLHRNFFSQPNPVRRIKS